MRPISYLLHACLLLCLCLPSQLAAQSDSQPETEEQERATPSYRTLSLYWSSGIHSYSSKLFRRGKRTGYNALDVRYAWQTTNEEEWARSSGHPSIGLGLYTAFLGDTKRFGRPISLYGFIQQDLARIGARQRLETTFTLGIAGDVARHDPDNSPIFEFMGSRLTVFFDLRLGIALQATRELDLTGGVFFTHMSNGRTFTPNLGLNASGLYLGTRYYYNAAQGLQEQPYYPARYAKPKRERLPLSEPRHSLSLYGAIGSVQNYLHESDSDAPSKGRYYPTSLLAEYEYRLTSNQSLSLGVDYFADPSLRPRMSSEGERIDLLGYHLGYRLRVWRLSLGLQYGSYFTDSRGKGNSYYRPSLRYDISPRLFAQVGLKTRNGATADWVEWGLGLKLYQW